MLASLYEVKLTCWVGSSRPGPEGAALVLHEERGVLRLERRARGEDQGRVERHRGAAVVDRRVGAGGAWSTKVCCVIIAGDRVALGRARQADHDDRAAERQLRGRVERRPVEPAVAVAVVSWS